MNFLRQSHFKGCENEFLLQCIRRKNKGIIIQDRFRRRRLTDFLYGSFQNMRLKHRVYLFGSLGQKVNIIEYKQTKFREKHTLNNAIDIESWCNNVSRCFWRQNRARTTCPGFTNSLTQCIDLHNYGESQFLRCHF